MRFLGNLPSILLFPPTYVRSYHRTQVQRSPRSHWPALEGLLQNSRCFMAKEEFDPALNTWQVSKLSKEVITSIRKTKATPNSSQHRHIRSIRWCVWWRLLPAFTINHSGAPRSERLTCNAERWKTKRALATEFPISLGNEMETFLPVTALAGRDGSLDF